MDTWHERTSPLDQVSQLVWGEEKKEGERGTERERDIFRERSSHFSLKFSAIGPSVSGEARSKVSPHDKGYAWVPVLGEFRQTPEGGGFSLTCFTLCLRVILMGGDLLKPEWPWFQFQKIWTE